MRKLMFAFLMFLSFQVVAAVEYSVPYDLSAGGGDSYLIEHNFGCIPTVLSLQSGRMNVAVWLIYVDSKTLGVRVINILSYPIPGAVTIRLGACQ